MKDLTPEKALLFRITHVDNVPWILENGLHCRNTSIRQADFRTIGNLDLISKRKQRVVPIPPGGTLSDYIPFYFTPYSIMLYNIKTGYGGVPCIPNAEVAILVSSLHRVSELDIPFVFTNQHAYPAAAEYFNSLDDLDNVDWPLLQARDFRHDPEDPGKKERYQAEALVHRSLPVNALLGIGCACRQTKQRLQQEIERRNIELPVAFRPEWYFQT